MKVATPGLRFSVSVLLAAAAFRAGAGFAAGQVVIANSAATSLPLSEGHGGEYERKEDGCDGEEGQIAWDIAQA